MRRALTLGLSALSLLLCVALCAMWVRSHWRYDALGFWPNPSAPRVVGLLSDEGTFCIASFGEGGGAGQQRLRLYAASAGRLGNLRSFFGTGRRLGFIFGHSPQNWVVGVPYW